MNTFTLSSIFIVLAVHYLFDFKFQTHWMASNKSKSNKALAAHVGVYTIGLIIMAVGFSSYFSLDKLALFVIINSLAHFGTDYVTSRMTSKLFNVDWHLFFAVVGIDQLIHYITIFTTLRFLNNF